jgi:phosphatidate cytidylyltransferase
MLKTRVITALVLMAVLLPIMYSGSTLAFAVIATLFFGAATWENQRLFKKPSGIVMAVIWSALFLYISLSSIPLSRPAFPALFAACILFWSLRLIPSLAFGLPGLTSYSSGLLSGIYGVCIFGCFIAMNALFLHSPIFLLSAMAIVWVADIGAYFSGKAFGKRKLAPSISPGKSWEGAIGGWIAVLIFGAGSTLVAALHDTVPTKILNESGWLGFFGVMTLLAAASVIGDLFESLLKRRAEMKDSSALLPGHGGVLDRIDALIPVLPMIALLDFFWK